jgi:hypothetical protein
MKRIIYPLLTLVLAGCALVSCSEEETNATDALSVAAFYPTLVMENIEVLITGTALDQVTDVVFPGGKSATALVLLDDTRLKAVAPEGVSAEAAPLIIKSDDREIASRQTIRQANPKLSYFNPADVALTYNSLYISGADFLLVDAIRFTGEAGETQVGALDFVRKSNTQINVVLPAATPTGDAVHISAIFKNGEVMPLGVIKVEKGQKPGGHWEEQEIPVYTGAPVATGAWGEWLTIAATPFADVKIEDIIRVYISDLGSNPQGGLRDASWSILAEGTDYFTIEDGHFYDFAVTDEAVSAKLKEGGMIIGGNNYTITKVVLVTQVWVEGGEEEKPTTDPITEYTIMLNDFEDDGSHNAHWDMSWDDGEATEVVTDETTGNTYIRLAKDLKGWISNCNHKDMGTVSSIENYFIKLDVFIPEGVTVPAAQGAQWVLGDNWVWVGDGLFPETTNGKWTTIRSDAAALGLSGDLVLGEATNGLYTGEPIPAGVCYDNLRLDPKE